VTYYGKDFWAHNTALFVADFHGNNPRFASYFLTFLDLWRFRSGVSVPTLDRNVFRKLPIIAPPVPEQRKIAAVLGLVQQAMEQEERLLALTAELKRRSSITCSPTASVPSPKNKPNLAQFRRVGRCANWVASQQRFQRVPLRDGRASSICLTAFFSFEAKTWEKDVWI